MRVIGDFLASLNDKQSNRLLTETFVPLYDRARTRSGLSPIDNTTRACRCMMMAAKDAKFWGEITHRNVDDGRPGFRYEELCERFGATRINAAIRNRILANRAHRILTNAPETVEVS